MSKRHRGFIARASCACLIASVLALVEASSAQAWYKHALLMPGILAGDPFPADQGLTPALRAAVAMPIAAACGDQDQRIYDELARSLLLNPSTKLGPTTAEACRENRRTTPYEVLTHGFVEDPDLGIDTPADDVSNSQIDPQGDRRWMGGKTGTGFRHMFFGGWKANEPLKTLQYPARPLGQAPERVALVATQARQLVQNGFPAWGWRLIAWTMHYVQDLAQPFHAVQVPSWRMISLGELLTWPPAQGFEALIDDTTRITTNYHWAIEGYVRNRLSLREDSVFFPCLVRADQFTTLVRTETIADPRRLALAVAQASVSLAAPLASAALRFFGTGLMDPSQNFPQGTPQPDYATLAIQPELADARQELHKATCQSLANAALASRWLIQWATASKRL